MTAYQLPQDVAKLLWLHAEEIDGPWLSACLEIAVYTHSQTTVGYFVSPAQQRKPLLGLTWPPGLGTQIIDWVHELASNPATHWNRLWFTVTPDGQCEMKGEWDPSIPEEEAELEAEGPPTFFIDPEFRALWVGGPRRTSWSRGHLKCPQADRTAMGSGGSLRGYGKLKRGATRRPT